MLGFLGKLSNALQAPVGSWPEGELRFQKAPNRGSRDTITGFAEDVYCFKAAVVRVVYAEASLRQLEAAVAISLRRIN
jgi:hypothetical protein